jgi:hypothetical protein
MEGLIKSYGVACGKAKEGAAATSFVVAYRQHKAEFDVDFLMVYLIRMPVSDRISDQWQCQHPRAQAQISVRIELL